MSTRTVMTTRTAMTTMFEPTIGLSPLTNGNGSLGETRRTGPMRYWPRISFNEWTFSLSLLAFSLAIVLGKLYVNYGMFRAI